MVINATKIGGYTKGKREEQRFLELLCARHYDNSLSDQPGELTGAKQPTWSGPMRRLQLTRDFETIRNI